MAGRSAPGYLQAIPSRWMTPVSGELKTGDVGPASDVPTSGSVVAASGVEDAADDGPSYSSSPGNDVVTRSGLSRQG